MHKFLYIDELTAVNSTINSMAMNTLVPKTIQICSYLEVLLFKNTAEAVQNNRCFKLLVYTIVFHLG